MKSRLLYLVIALGLVLPTLFSVQEASAHTGYDYCQVPSGGSCYFKDFYISAGKWHWFQQTSPDNKLCYHTIYDRASGIAVGSIWLRGNNDPRIQYDEAFGIRNDGTASRAFRHRVSGCAGPNQVYNYH